MTKLAAFIKPLYSTPVTKNSLTGININLKQVTNDIPIRLMTKLKNTLKSNKKTHDLYFGLIKKPSGSEYDIALAFALKNQGYTLNEIGNILYHYEHGSISKKIDGPNKWRQIERCYLRCDNHRPKAEDEFDSVSQIDLDRINTQLNPIFETLPKKSDKTFRCQHLPKMDWRYSGFPIYKDFLFENTIIVIYGQSNVGKSFVALDIAGHIALSRNWGELVYKPKKKTAVIYICAEAGASFGKRGKALYDRLKVKNPSEYDFPFFVIDASPNFAKDKDDAEKIITVIQDIEKKHQIKIGLIVVDTLATTFEGGNENSSEDMGIYISNMKHIQRHADTGVLIVHHSGKDQAAGARGHSSLRAATDTEIEITAEKAGTRHNRKIIVKKQREGENDKVIPFALGVTELGKDNDGDPITTCYVILNSDTEFDSVFAKPEDILTGRQKAVYITCIKFQEPDFLHFCINKKSTDIRKLMVNYWFLLKNNPEKSLLLGDFRKIDCKCNYSNESPNFSNDFNKVLTYLNNEKLTLDQWIKEYVVKASQTLSDPN